MKDSVVFIKKLLGRRKKPFSLEMEHLDDGLEGVERRGDPEGVSESKQIDFRNASDAGYFSFGEEG